MNPLTLDCLIVIKNAIDCIWIYVSPQIEKDIIYKTAHKEKKHMLNLCNQCNTR